MDKVKVLNERRYDIGLRLQNGTERVIKSRSYALLPKDEIEFLASLAPALFYDEKQLRLEDRSLAVALGFIQDVNLPVFGEAEIRKQLAQRQQQLKAWLDAIQEPFLLDEVYAVAMTMDLPASKLQLLQERMPDRAMIQTEAM